MIKTVGSVCSGIEAASVAWKLYNVSFEWFSEIADFPARVLKEKYPEIPNVGDMNRIPKLIEERAITAPDIICGGTPCQAFSLAGRQNGLNDERGNLTLKFVDIINANDKARMDCGKSRCKVFWENVDGVLKDKTNAFGCLISSLAGLSDILTPPNGKWPNAGTLYGKTRNIAWRVLDAKYFGIPQQRRRLYVVAGGKDFSPESVLFEIHRNELPKYPNTELRFTKEGHNFEVFREYTDCLYSAYGTKWNGNAAAYNGSLFIAQDDRLRRISPLEAERLMGFPDGYTDLTGAKKTNRYQSIGNSWAVPVVRWIGKRLIGGCEEEIRLDKNDISLSNRVIQISTEETYFDFGKDIIVLGDGTLINCTHTPENSSFSDMKSVVSSDASKDIYISPVGCYGILRRKNERKLRINPRLEEILTLISSEMEQEEIEKKSRVQQRGKYSASNTNAEKERIAPLVDTHIVQEKQLAFTECF